MTMLFLNVEIINIESVSIHNEVHPWSIESSIAFIAVTNSARYAKAKPIGKENAPKNTRAVAKYTTTSQNTGGAQERGININLDPA